MPTIDQNTKEANRMNPASVVVERLPEEIKPFAFIVGRWVWVKFLQAPNSEWLAILKFEGFHWNDTRKVWQHCGGIKRRFNRRGNPLNQYSVVAVTENNII